MKVKEQISKASCFRIVSYNYRKSMKYIQDLIRGKFLVKILTLFKNILQNKIRHVDVIY